ncbi:hypothetical protein ScPMuIL_017318 [Solemya velum]
MKKEIFCVLVLCLFVAESAFYDKGSWPVSVIDCRRWAKRCFDDKWSMYDIPCLELQNRCYKLYVFHFRFTLA